MVLLVPSGDTQTSFSYANDEAVAPTDSPKQMMVHLMMFFIRVLSFWFWFSRMPKSPIGQKAFFVSTGFVVRSVEVIEDGEKQ